MLVVTANWGITDRSAWSGATAASAGRFLAAVRRSAIRAGWRPDGSYRPIASVDIVLAGDTFDWLGSLAWLGTVRPWHHGRRSEPVRERVISATIRPATAVLGPLVRALRRGVTVPMSDRHGRPRFGIMAHIPLRVTLLEGDLDQGLACGPTRHLAERMGIGVGETWSACGISVCHGHRCDPLWPAAAAEDSDSRCPTLGMSLRVDLVCRFASVVASDPLTAAVGRKLVADLAARHPLSYTDLVRQACGADGGAADATDRLRAAWLESVETWRRLALRAGVHGDTAFDLVDALAARLSDIDSPASSPPACPADDALGLGLEAVPVSLGQQPTVAGLMLRGARLVVCGHPAAELSQLPSQGDRADHNPAAGAGMLCIGPRVVPASQGGNGASEVTKYPDLESTAALADADRPPAAVIPGDGEHGGAEVVVLWDEIPPWKTSGRPAAAPGRVDHRTVVDAA